MSVNLKSALILPGAVAKGAFEAGVIDILVQKDVQIDRIIATSSGALNAVALAAAIRSGHTQKMAESLVNTWITGGGWNNSLSFSPINFFLGKGLSDPSGLLKMLGDLVKPCTSSAKNEIELRIVVAALNGAVGKIGDESATTYEQGFAFSGEDFDTEEGLKQIFAVTTAACAFPGLFAPVELKDIGPCLDGGAVNNAPIRYALADDLIGTIYMPVPFPSMTTKTAPKSGFGMLNHLVEILINERLYRELKSAQSVNDDVDKLQKLVAKGILTNEQVATVQTELDIRKIQIKQIRPERSLGTNPFSGFFSKADRLSLIEEGRKAALKTLSQS